MRRPRLRRLAALAAATACLAPAAAHGAEWRSEQPVGPGGVPVPLGPIGDVEFWAPNRGLLITAGNDAVRGGVFAYDGTGWRQISTVCGGHGGRIAWAGPNEFWTVSDVQPGAEILDVRGGYARSLCHFVDGELVASYAEPLNASTAYRPMTSAACLAPADCWFAGGLLPGTLNRGAFHLRWNGSALTAVPSLETLQPDVNDPARPVADLVAHQGVFYESVRVEFDADVPNEPADQPFRLHRIDPESSSPFLPLLYASPLEHGSVPPHEVDAFHLTSDGGELWGMAGVRGDRGVPTFVRLDAAGLVEQIPLSDPDDAMPEGTFVNDVALEPGTGSAWIAYYPRSDVGFDVDPARVARVGADGSVGDAVAVPAAGQGLGRKGQATVVACSAPGQCWMATETGWLFHYGDALERDSGFRFQQPITQRPRDRSLPTLPPDELPDDDSGAIPPAPEVVPSGPPAKPSKPRRAKALVVKPHRRMVTPTTLELSFTLRAKARVRLVARRDRRVVAATPRRVLKRGRHSLRLRLSRDRWPNKLSLDAKAVGGGTEPRRDPNAYFTAHRGDAR